MRNVPCAMQKIRDLCSSLYLDENNVLAKTELFIKAYPEIVWANNHDKKGQIAKPQKICEKKSETAMRYIADFEPAEGKTQFLKKMIMLFDIKWLTELISSAMKHIEDFPDYGTVYIKILTNLFSDDHRPDQLCQKDVRLEKTAFYNRKKEAIFLFGVELWGIVIPKYLDLYGESI